MRYRGSILVAVVVPSLLAAQATPASGPRSDVILSFENFADLFGSRLVAAFDSIPAARYDYRPTTAQQTIGYIAQHLENANYSLCESFADIKHRRTRKDSLPDTVKARWPKDTLVARLAASLRFCDTTLERVSQLQSGALASSLLAFETDLAEHYSQLSAYMRLLGIVPPSALPPVPRQTIELRASALAPLVGVYQIVAGRRLDVTMHDGMLFVKSSGGGATVRLWPVGPNDFFVNEVDAQIAFTRDSRGAVAGLVVHQYGRDRLAARVR